METRLERLVCRRLRIRQTPQRRIQARQCGTRIVQLLVTEVQRAAVLTGQNEVTHLLGLVTRQDLANGEEVVQGFRHLLVVDAHEAVVHPVADERMTGRTLGLGDLVLVVRKSQVGAAAMDVEGVTERLGRHRRALDVPTRPPRAPRRLPGGFAGLGRLPQREVQRIALGLAGLDTRPGLQVGERFARQPTVPREAVDVVVDVTVVGDIGMPALDQAFDHVDDVGQVLGRTWLLVRRQHAQRRGVLVHRPDETLGQRLERFAALVRPVDDLVVYVGDVAYVGHVVTQQAQVARDHVKHHHDARMPEVAQVVDRHAADIHVHAARVQRLEGLFGAGQVVVQVQHRDPEGAAVKRLIEGEY